jgi:hypothetical protein
MIDIGNMKKVQEDAKSKTPEKPELHEEEGVASARVERLESPVFVFIGAWRT